MTKYEVWAYRNGTYVLVHINHSLDAAVVYAENHWGDDGYLIYRSRFFGMFHKLIKVAS